MRIDCIGIRAKWIIPHKGVRWICIASRHFSFITLFHGCVLCKCVSVCVCVFRFFALLPLTQNTSSLYIHLTFGLKAFDTTPRYNLMYGWCHTTQPIEHAQCCVRWCPLILKFIRSLCCKIVCCEIVAVFHINAVFTFVFIPLWKTLFDFVETMQSYNFGI